MRAFGLSLPSFGNPIELRVGRQIFAFFVRQKPADSKDWLRLDVLLQLPANGSYKLIALGQDAVLNLKNFLAEFALAALGLGNFSLQDRLLREVGDLVGCVAQFADAFFDVLKCFFGTGHLIVGPAIELGEFGFKKARVSLGYVFEQECLNGSPLA